jgi:hypothetical protein
MAQNPATAPTHQTWSDKNLVNATDWTGLAFEYLAEKFPPLSKAKIKEGGFCGSLDLQALQRYVQQPASGRRERNLGRVSCVSAIFLGNIGTENYKQLFEDMSLYHKLDCNMSLKIHVPPHMDYFPAA